ncbi:MAG: sodium/glutamate symporter [Kiritimatiellia bacterium]|jgi:ESS family glutamate:Na+ symporter|nr:sodium/glutamate symporter [Kiritimatiellia bacterium]MDP6847278.1 sodium/glutamate symporter [Kiritimatiellia bacterium]
MNIALSFGALCFLLALGKFLRVKVKAFHSLHLPASVIAGLLGLSIVQCAGPDISSHFTAGWSKLPGLLINIVFAALFLGVTVPPLREIWRKSGPQLAYGQVVAWGQYVVGLGLVLMCLGPLFGVSHLFGVIVPVGFEGGHGTAGGLGPTFTELGWAEGTDYALASATAGIISAIVVGMALVNWASQKGVLTQVKGPGEMSRDELVGLYPVENRPIAGKQTVAADSVDALALHLAIIGIAILVGLGIKTGLARAESFIPALRDVGVMRRFPLFPLCMIGGLLVQLTVTRFARISPIDHGLMQRLGGTALDFLVVAAISTIRVEVIGEGFVPFVVIVAGGIVWNVFCVVWLAKRMLPDFWFERAIAEMGQSMGVTATGLLLLRVVDPESKTSAPSAFGYKQLLHEPFMGGGLWTSMAVLFVWRLGAWPVLGISIGAITAWLVVWWFVLRKPGH